MDFIFVGYVSYVKEWNRVSSMVAQTAETKFFSATHCRLAIAIAVSATIKTHFTAKGRNVNNWIPDKHWTRTQKQARRFFFTN